MHFRQFIFPVVYVNFILLSSNFILFIFCQFWWTNRKNKQMFKLVYLEILYTYMSKMLQSVYQICRKVLPKHWFNLLRNAFGHIYTHTYQLCYNPNNIGLSGVYLLFNTALTFCTTFAGNIYALKLRTDVK
jgi:hypothetical protein